MNFKSLAELHKVAKSGNTQAQRMCIATLENLGAEHLAKTEHGFPKWEAYYHGLRDYWASLVGEYGQSEDAALRELLDEVNHSASYCGGVELE